MESAVKWQPVSWDDIMGDSTGKVPAKVDRPLPLNEDFQCLGQKKYRQKLFQHSSPGPSIDAGGTCMYTVDKSVPPWTGLLCSVAGPSKGPKGREKREESKEPTALPNKALQSSGAPVGPCMASEEVKGGGVRALAALDLVRLGTGHWTVGAFFSGSGWRPSK